MEASLQRNCEAF